MSHTFAQKQIAYTSAAAIVAAAVQRAEVIGIAVVVTVIDTRGSIKAMANMDGAGHLAISASNAKAYTSLMGLGSGVLAQAMEGQLAQLNSLLSFDNVVALGGGLPILVGGELVGAVGVGGGSQEQDIECVRAGLDALK